MKKEETISEIKLKINLGEKLNASESKILIDELKGNKYIELLLNELEFLLVIKEKLNKAKKDSVHSLNGGNGDCGLNLFATEMQLLISNNISDLDNKISEIAELDSIYFKK